MPKTKTDKRSRLIQTAVKLASGMASGRRVSPISRKQPRSRWGTFTTTSRRKMRSARPLWSNVYWNCGRCRNSGTRGAPRKNAFWPVSRIRLKTGIYLPAEDVPSGLCAPNCTRRAASSEEGDGALHGTAGVDGGSISGDWTRRHLTKARYPTVFFIAGSIGPGSWVW